jgi:hypothetical protein
LEDGKTYTLYETYMVWLRIMKWFGIYLCLLNVNINFDNYFKIKINGIYSIINDKIVVSENQVLQKSS